MVTTVALICEMDLMDDAIRSLSYAMGALSCRVGSEYRDYERRLSALLDAPLSDCTFAELEPGRLVIVPPIEWRAMVIVPPIEWRAMVDEGSRLGVI